MRPLALCIHKTLWKKRPCCPRHGAKTGFSLPPGLPTPPPRNQILPLPPDTASLQPIRSFHLLLSFFSSSSFCEQEVGGRPSLPSLPLGRSTQRSILPPPPSEPSLSKMKVSKEHARGSLLGVFVGDAAGATVEFSHGKISEQIARGAMRMPGGGKMSVGPGQVTDDSELAMALAHALAMRNPKEGLPMDAIACAYRAWYESNPFDVGQTCTLAFSSPSSPLDAGDQGDQSSTCTTTELGVKMLENEGIARGMRAAAAGFSRDTEANGALMRIVPMAIWLAGQPLELIVRGAKEDALLSHPNPVCQECNAAYVLTITHLLTHPGDQQGALKLAEQYAHHHMHTKAKHWLLEDSVDVSGLDCTYLVGHVRYAFTLAFFFLRQAASYEDAIALTLQKGGDTDTNAAIVGGLLGAFHGAECIPSFMKDPVLSFDCTLARVSRKGIMRPLAYSTRRMEEILDGLLSSNEANMT